MNSKFVVGGTTGLAGLAAMAMTTATPLIQEFEGRRTLPYYDVVKVLTVCDGYTGKDIVIGKKYTDAECEALTTRDVERFSKGILKCTPHLAYHPMQMAAVISFTYNLGETIYCKSSIAKLFNEGKFIEACNFFPRYKYAGGKVYNGLVRRRAAEQSLCLSTLTPKGLDYVTVRN